ncbi:MAG: TolB family protein [Anaerolineales bacterium]
MIIRRIVYILALFGLLSGHTGLRADEPPTADRILWVVARAGDAPDDPQALYRVTLDSRATRIIDFAAGYTVAGHAPDGLLLNDGQMILEWGTTTPRPYETPALADDDFESRLSAALADSPTPLMPPRRITASEYDLFVMSGPNTPHIDLYALYEGDVLRISNVVAHFPQAAMPILSASVRFISIQPSTGDILYRAQLRAADGTHYNALYLYNLATGTRVAFPYFGQDPVFSPDGTQVVGGRLNAEGSQYMLWRVHLESAETEALGPGCRPAWSPDRDWLAYDGHTTAIWQGYTDCFANGDVYAVHLATGETIHVSADITPDVQLVGWQP